MRHVAVVVAVLLVASAAHAAQDARVRVDQAPIHEKSDEASAVLDRVPRGTTLRVSERNRAGFYRVRLLKPMAGLEYGWIRMNDVILDTAATDLKAAGITTADVVSREMTHPKFVLRGFYRMHYLKPQGATKYESGAGLGGEIGYKLGSDDAFVLSGHVESLSFSQPVSGGTAAASALSLALVGDYVAWHSPPFRLRFGVGAGVANGTQLSFTPTGGSATSTEAFLAPMGFGRFLFSWYFLSQVALNLEVGYRYLEKKGVALGSSTVDAKLSSAFGGGGLVIEF